MLFGFGDTYQMLVDSGMSPETVKSMGIFPLSPAEKKQQEAFAAAMSANLNVQVAKMGYDLQGSDPNGALKPKTYTAAEIKALEDDATAKSNAVTKTMEDNLAAQMKEREEAYPKILNELKTQYNNLVKLAPEAAYRGRASDLERIFAQQARELADKGVLSILDLANIGGNLVNTGKNGGLIAVISTDRDTGAVKWGDIFSGVKGGANYGISFDKEGKPIMYPVYEKSKSLAAQVFGSDLFKLVSLGLTLYGVYNLATALTSAAGVATASAAASTAAEAVGSEAAKTVATEAVKEAGKTAVEKALTDMAINAGIGGVIFEAAGGDFLTGAVVGALGSVGSTTYAESVGKAIVPSATAAAQVTVGNAVINSGLSGLVASATGGDVTKSMLAGAARGASIASSKTIAEALVGKDNIAAIVSATNLTTSQVENLITTSVTNGLIAEVSGQGNFTDAMLTTLVSGGVGTSVANGVVNNINLDVAAEKGIFSATRNLASAATSAVVQGQDVGLALEMAAPGAILSGYQAYEQELDRQDAAKGTQVGATQQPLQVAGVTAGQLTQGEIATQAARTRGEEVVGTSTEDGVTTYQMTGVRDDGSRYYYKILDIPDVGIKYEYSQLPTDPITLRVIPGAQMGTQVQSEPPDFRGDATIGLPTTDIVQQLQEVERPTFEPIVIPQDIRQATTQSLIESELQRLENELSTINQQQRAFEGAKGQFERLSDLPAGTIEQDLQRQLEQELADLERQATEGQGRIAQIERERGAIEGIGTEGGRTLSDEELLGYLETGELPQGLLGGQPEGEGTAPEGGLEAGEGGEGTGTGGEGEGEGGEEEVTTEPTTITTPLSPTVLFSQELPARPETTPFSSRVTGEALEGILGEKEPLFGGDEDEQRAVWNRRSLRLLSRALGL